MDLIKKYFLELVVSVSGGLTAFALFRSVPSARSAPRLPNRFRQVKTNIHSYLNLLDRTRQWTPLNGIKDNGITDNGITDNGINQLMESD